MRRAAAGALLLVLPGCLAGAPEVSRTATTLTVADRPMVIAGPPGFCVDPRATQIGVDNAFVLLGNCAAITGRPGARQPDLRALLTATVAESDTPDAVARAPGRLDAFFRSAAGRRALSRDGRAASVRVLESFAQGGVYFLHASDRSNGIVPGMAADYWRAYFDLDGRIVSVSALGFRDAPLSRSPAAWPPCASSNAISGA